MFRLLSIFTCVLQSICHWYPSHVGIIERYPSLNEFQNTPLKPRFSTHSRAWYLYVISPPTYTRCSDTRCNCVLSSPSATAALEEAIAHVGRTRDACSCTCLCRSRCEWNGRTFMRQRLHHLSPQKPLLFQSPPITPRSTAKLADARAASRELPATRRPSYRQPPLQRWRRSDQHARHPPPCEKVPSVSLVLAQGLPARRPCWPE